MFDRISMDHPSWILVEILRNQSSPNVPLSLPVFSVRLLVRGEQLLELGDGAIRVTPQQAVSVVFNNLAIQRYSIYSF